ncbi:hypothetical protein HON22_05050, partial [Candidatus Peregrinibacteria bacterium]|nr:hypothetical protein [Candidatus Peregrinibacteria bacterium]
MKKIQNQIDGIQEKFKSIFRGSVISTTTTKLMSFIQIADARARIIIIIN